MAESKVITGIVRFSYAHVWEPQAIDPQKPEDKKYSVSIIIDKKDKKTIKDIQDAIKAATDLGLEKLWNGKLPKRFKNPLRDGDEERDDDDVYAKAFFLNANSKDKPTIVDRAVNPIITQADFYSGCYGRASVSFFPFDKAGNVGIGCSLNHLQKTKDGDSLGGSKASAEADFSAIPDDEDDLLD
jgi:hypothetical protein